MNLAKLREITEEDGSVSSLYYRLVRTADERGGDVFSVLVMKYRPGSPAERRFVFDVTRDEETARSIFRSLTDGLVTPVAVRDVIEDLLSTEPRAETD